MCPKRRKFIAYPLFNQLTHFLSSLFYALKIRSSSHEGRRLSDRFLSLFDCTRNAYRPSLHVACM